VVRLFNPLLGSPADLKDADLEAKINELTRKYTIAARTGMNQVLPQLALALEIYREELTKRGQESLKTTARKANGNLDDLINVE
jgi:hypothetical protein